MLAWRVKALAHTTVRTDIESQFISETIEFDNNGCSADVDCVDSAAQGMGTFQLLGIRNDRVPIQEF